MVGLVGERCVPTPSASCVLLRGPALCAVPTVRVKSGSGSSLAVGLLGGEFPRAQGPLELCGVTACSDLVSLGAGSPSEGGLALSPTVTPSTGLYVRWPGQLLLLKVQPGGRDREGVAVPCPPLPGIPKYRPGCATSHLSYKHIRLPSRRERLLYPPCHGRPGAPWTPRRSGLHTGSGGRLHKGDCVPKARWGRTASPRAAGELVCGYQAAGAVGIRPALNGRGRGQSQTEGAGTRGSLPLVLLLPAPWRPLTCGTRAQAPRWPDGNYGLDLGQPRCWGGGEG